MILDSSCIVALLDRSERYHSRCVEVVTELESTLITCEAVITESCYLVRDLKGAGEAIIQNVAVGEFQVPFRLIDDPRRIGALMRKYADVPMDFADACLVDLARQFQTGRILTLDSDFRIFRWGRNRPFELLIDLPVP